MKGRIREGEEERDEGVLKPVLPSATRCASLTSLASSFSCLAGALMPPKRKERQSIKYRH